MNDDEPIVPVSVPDVPDYLDGEEADVFVEVGSKLARMRVMSDADVDALSIYAVNFVRWRDATAKVREMGLVVRSPKNYPIQNPWLAIANRAQKDCMSILAEFGLTPSSRTRVHAK
jgi:P27 family predicted phage terminase small subunit